MTFVRLSAVFVAASLSLAPSPQVPIRCCAAFRHRNGLPHGMMDTMCSSSWLYSAGNNSAPPVQIPPSLTACCARSPLTRAAPCKIPLVAGDGMYCPCMWDGHADLWSQTLPSQ